jgi:hypothetical protein
MRPADGGMTGRVIGVSLQRPNLVRMIGEERPPCVRRPWLMPAHVLRDRGLTQRDTSFWSSP